MLDYNPYLQGNPLIANVTPEMQEAARQRAIFNAGAAMLGSAGRGESFVSGISQAGQMYGGSLDQMMNEGLRYQSARQQQEHQKELMGFEREKLKQDAELRNKDIETRLKIGEMNSASERMRAALLREQMKREQENTAFNRNLASNMLMGGIDKASLGKLKEQGYAFDESNPQAAAAAASLYRKQLGFGGGPLNPQQFSALIAQQPAQEQAKYLALFGTDSNAVRTAFPSLYNPSLYGSGEQTPAAPAIPTATPQQAKVNADIMQFNKQLSDIKAEVYGPNPWTPLLNPVAAMVSAPTGKKQLSKERVKEIRDRLTSNQGLITRENQEEVQAILNRLEQEERGMAGFGTKAYQNLFR